MKILILGGTRFLGRHLVDAALAAGHEITLFNRGRSGPGLFPEVQTLVGDRDGDLSSLKGGKWDSVVDTCGYVPRVVGASVEALKDSVGLYVFVSSVSVYADTNTPGVAEKDPVGTLEDTTVEEITGETYGPLKALCEAAVEELMPGRALNIRPGLIVGPFDPSDRFTYWPRRVARGGNVLAPGAHEKPIQIIDARDLAKWTIRLIERSVTGVFTATGPAAPIPLGELLAACKDVTNSDANFVWIDDECLIKEGAGPWMEIPLWLPGKSGLMEVDVDKAVSEGLTFRPLEQIIRDTYEWDSSRPKGTKYAAGLDPEKEKVLLAACAG